MPKIQTIFKRYEKKYIVTREQKENFLEDIKDYIMPDKFGESTLCNIYFDTPDFRLIRNSIEKPIYKEKLRIRSYGVPTAQSDVFVELKKKYKGVVYKRRIKMSYLDAVNYLCRGLKPETKNQQILSEIDYFLLFYPKIRPAASLFYDRTAYYSKEDSELRLTFDTNIRFRFKNFDLSKGSEGHYLMKDDKAILELKCVGSMPLWLTHALDKHKIYPSSFSKYGEAYKLIFNAKMKAKTKKNDIKSEE
ncbi:MAG: polyphosphate polymerase domain-containing protein [Clostridia bacterium]|nr:polyphosphate polymerase domain-containing protein [Clostridia bacterium]